MTTVKRSSRSEACADRPGLRVRRQRVGAVDDERADRGVGVAEDRAHLRHRERADGVGAEVLAHQRRGVALEEPARRVGEPAAGQPPVAGDRGERGERAQRHAAARVALDAHRGADRGRPRRRDAAAERLDPLDGQVADRGRALGRVRLDLARGTPPSPRCGRAGRPRRARRRGRRRASARARAPRPCRAAARGARPPAAAVRVRTGSIDDEVRAGLARLQTNFQKWWWLVSGFEPQRRISLACAKPSGSIVALVPSVRRSPVVPAAEQIVIRWSLAPSVFHSRAPDLPSRPCR